MSVRSRPWVVLLAAGAAELTALSSARLGTGARGFWAIVGAMLYVLLWRGHRAAWRLLTCTTLFGVVVLGTTAFASKATAGQRWAALFTTIELAALLSSPVRAWVSDGERYGLPQSATALA